MAIRETNLIPEEILSYRHLVRHLYFWAGCLGVSLAVIFGFHMYQTNIALAQKEDPPILKDKDTNLVAKIKEIKQIQRELDELNKKQVALERITDSTPYSLIIQRLSEAADGYVWFSLLAIEGGKQKDEPISVRVTGFSPRNEELGEFLNRLSGDPLFDAVFLNYATESKTLEAGRGSGDLMDLIGFQIVCRMKKG